MPSTKLTIADRADLSAQWHEDRNLDFEPEKILLGSHRKVWWQCPVAPDHEWDAAVRNRANGAGCPFCSGRRASSTNNFALKAPHLLEEWDLESNGDLKPTDVTVGSSKKVNWRCKVDPTHRWQASPSSRTGTNETGCPFCSGNVFSKTNSLARQFPNVAKEWDYEKNFPRTLREVTAKASKKVWWLCPVHPSHSWRTSIGNRTGNQSGCPYCVGKLVCETNSLATTHPQLSMQWHQKKNGRLTPNDVTAGSHKSVWWQCTNERSHHWKAAIKSRALIEAGCPFCSGNRVHRTNCLATIHPKLSKEWHPTKNGNLKPSNIIAGSNKKFWWNCPKGPDHEWLASAGMRASGSGCPFCARYKVSMTNSLAEQFPEIAREWHPTKNGSLTPSDVTSGTLKKSWWKCSVANDHEWEATPKARTQRGYGCLCCSGRKLSVTNRLDLLRPEIAAQWHPDKNGEAKPSDFKIGSSRVVWWKCEKGPDHEWQKKIRTRAHPNSGCPFCNGDLVSVTNSLENKASEVAKEWHPTKNTDLNPKDVTAGSSKKVWWKCQNNPQHEWPSTIKSRVSGNGCPYCTLHPASKSEVYLAFELKHFFSVDPLDHTIEIDGALLDCDIILRDHKVVVEYDGNYYHDTVKKRRSNLKKNHQLEAAGWIVLRVREAPPKKIRKYDVVGKPRPFLPLLQSAVGAVSAIHKRSSRELDDYLGGNQQVAKTETDEFIRKVQSNVYPMQRPPTTDPEKVLTLDQVLRWADKYYEIHKTFPGQTSPSIPSMGDEKWVNIDSALRSGGRGLPSHGGLAGLLVSERNHTHNYSKPFLIEASVIEWMIEHYSATDPNEWPK